MSGFLQTEASGTVNITVGGGGHQAAVASYGASTLISYHITATTNGYQFHGDVGLASKPTFAVNTP